jgi:endo-1,4-beta-xylanase
MKKMSRREALKLSAAGLAGAAMGPAMGCSSLGGMLGGSPSDPNSLRSLADKRGLLVGSACALHLIKGSPVYAEILAREFNCTVAENDMKMDALVPARGKYQFSNADETMAFAEKHDMAVRAIPLVWHDGLPGWAADKTFEREEALEIIREHIFTVVPRYNGKIFAWDVLNEGIGDHGPGMQDKGPWFRSIGPDYAEKAYRWAHEADPKAQLFYNDFYINRFSVKAQRTLDWLKEQLERDVPIHGVGLQYHVQVGNTPRIKEATDNIQRFIDLGLIVHITELDVWLPKNYTEEHLQEQAKIYHDVFKMALSIPELPCVVMWGFCDIHSWVRYTSGGSYDDALIFDREYKPKPAYEAIRTALREG